MHMRDYLTTCCASEVFIFDYSVNTHALFCTNYKRYICIIIRVRISNNKSNIIKTVQPGVDLCNLKT